jgi:hypothetical protein
VKIVGRAVDVGRPLSAGTSIALSNAKFLADGVLKKDVQVVPAILRDGILR